MKVEFKNTHNDRRGLLVFFENGSELNFDIQRVFYIKNVPNRATRGHHAHLETKQLLTVVNGSCEILLDDGLQQQNFKLSQDQEAVFQDKLVWGHMHSFSKDCILLVFASKPYSEKDYIRNYVEFLNCVKPLNTVRSEN